MDVALHQHNRFVPKDDISKRSGLALHELLPILTAFQEAGVLQTARGRSGGYRFPKSPEELQLAWLLPRALLAAGWPPCALEIPNPCAGGERCLLGAGLAALRPFSLEAIARLSLADLLGLAVEELAIPGLCSARHGVLPFAVEPPAFVVVDGGGRIVLANSIAWEVAGWAAGGSSASEWTLQARGCRLFPAELKEDGARLLPLPVDAALVGRDGSRRPVQGAVASLAAVARAEPGMQACVLRRLDQLTGAESVAILFTQERFRCRGAQVVSRTVGHALASAAAEAQLARLEGGLLQEQTQALVRVEKGCLRGLRSLAGWHSWFGESGGAVLAGSLAEAVQKAAEATGRSARVAAEPVELRLNLGGAELEVVLGAVLEAIAPPGGLVEVNWEARSVDVVGEALVGPGAYVVVSLEARSPVRSTEEPGVAEELGWERNLALLAARAVLRRAGGAMMIEEGGSPKKALVYLRAEPLGAPSAEQSSQPLLKVLVLEPEEAIGSVLGRLLERLELRAWRARSLLEAEQLARAAVAAGEPFGLLILAEDVLAEPSGERIAAELVGLAGNRVIVTCWPGGGHREWLLEGKGVRKLYIEAPFTPAELQQAVIAALAASPADGRQ